MKQNRRAVALLLIVATAFSSCSMLTASGRRERAYERYVRKSSLGRVKQQKRFAFTSPATIPATQPNESSVGAEASGPESVSGNGDGGGGQQ